MNERPRQRLGTISILLGAIPVLALISWFVFYTPCGHPRRVIIEGAMFWGTIVAVPFGIFAAVKERPRTRALIGLRTAWGGQAQEIRYYCLNDIWRG